eukprot:554933-Amphidinium_carterae.1
MHRELLHSLYITLCGRVAVMYHTRLSHPMPPTKWQSDTQNAADSVDLLPFCVLSVSRENQRAVTRQRHVNTWGVRSKQRHINTRPMD